MNITSFIKNFLLFKEIYETNLGFNFKEELKILMLYTFLKVRLEIIENFRAVLLHLTHAGGTWNSYYKQNYYNSLFFQLILLYNL